MTLDTRICLLTSTSRRHAFVARRLAAETDLALVVREEKGLERFYENHPDRELIMNHFGHLAATETRYFADVSWESLETEMLTVARGKLNTPDIASRIKEAHVDCIVLFGCGLIKSPILEILRRQWFFNLHQGLSPYYRGSGTNFWPFVEGQPEYIGMTLHTVDEGTDTGGIIAHARPEIRPDDTLHTLGCRTVEISVETLLRVLHLGRGWTDLEAIPQWSKGKLYRRKDLNGGAIRKMRELESSGFLGDFLQRREAGLIPPIRLVLLEP